jgi:hypothetical protein
MSLIATLALAASAGASLPQCSWDRPGVNPFMGDVVTAVDRYTDIPAATRDKLKARMKARQYDEIAVIDRDSIRGKAQYAPEISDMHFGQGSVCRTVTRAKWTARMEERGLVYCEDGQCILVPTVCRNVSRIRRLAAPAAVAPAHAANTAASTRVAAEEAQPLEFEAPAAGPLAAAAPGSFAAGSGAPGLGGAGAGAPGGGFSSAPSPLLASGGGNLPAPIVMGMPGLPGRVGIASGPTLPPVTPAVPEPSTWMLIAAGVLVVCYRARRKL